LDKERLFSHLRGEDERRIGDHVLGLAKLAWETNKPQVTDFYDPYQQQVARSVLGSIPEVGVLVQGGYKQAERARLVVYPQFYVMSAIQSPLSVLEAKGNFSFHNVGHGDFLGSLLATGLDRDKIGDIIVLALRLSGNCGCGSGLITCSVTGPGCIRFQWMFRR